jgi:2-oxoglutarate dehydrogenase complex dehydrogenase (E1) component-like enzyme
MQVCYLSTPAQYFHAMRRQIHRKFRKPLILMQPKYLLRWEPGSSRIEEFTDRGFQLLIDDPAQPAPSRVRRLLLCSGKVYYTLNSSREKEHVDDVAIVRVEQLYPLPRKELAGILQKYTDAEEIAWVQEEPANRGAWYYMQRQMPSLLPEMMTLAYYGREAAASPATGSVKVHQIEEQELVAHALKLSSRREAAKAARSGAAPVPVQSSPTAQQVGAQS